MNSKIAYYHCYTFNFTLIILQVVSYAEAVFNLKEVQRLKVTSFWFVQNDINLLKFTISNSWYGSWYVYESSFLYTFPWTIFEVDYSTCSTVGVRAISDSVIVTHHCMTSSRKKKKPVALTPTVVIVPSGATQGSLPATDCNSLNYNDNSYQRIILAEELLITRITYHNLIQNE